MNENEFEKVVPETEDSVVEETPIEAEESNEIEAEEVEETAIDEVADETAAEDFAEETVSEEMVEEIIEEQPVQKKKSKVLLIVLLVIVLVLALIAGSIYVIFGTDVYNKLGLDKSGNGSFSDLMRNTVTEIKEEKSDNKYNNLGYANPSGNTIQDIADGMGVTVEEFLEQYGLPADMPADTEEMAAYYSIPVKVFAQMYGVDFATFKEGMGIPDETTPPVVRTIGDKINEKLGKFEPQKIDENTAWGVVEDELTLGKYIGEENVETFKEYYGITAEINADTRYKEVRRAVDEKNMQLAAEAKAAEEEQKQENTDAESDAAEVETDTDAAETETTEE